MPPAANKRYRGDTVGGPRTTIKVSEQVKAALDRIKERNGHTSYDSVIRYLLWRAGEGEEVAAR